MHIRAEELIEALGLSAHPEGGHFREVFRSVRTVDPGDGRGARDALTAIYFLLRSGEVSRWHRVASDEAWHFIEGDPLELHEADAAFDRVTTRLLGPYDGTVQPVRVIQAGSWQAARSTGAYTLVACTVAPGFVFDDFELLDDATLTSTLQARHPHLARFT